MAGTAFVSGLAACIAARILQGIAQAGLFPTATVTVAKWFPKTGRAFATGSLGSFMSVGGALCAWLTGVLLEALEPRVATGWNWRLTFLLFAVPGLVWAAWFWRWFRDEPGEHPSVNEAELSLIADGFPTTRSVLPASCRQGKEGICQQDAGSTFLLHC
jgi:ACS family glucarate transporter-like MFS transporter